MKQGLAANSADILPVYILNFTALLFLIMSCKYAYDTPQTEYILGLRSDITGFKYFCVDSGTGCCRITRIRASSITCSTSTRRSPARAPARPGPCARYDHTRNKQYTTYTQQII